MDKLWTKINENSSYLYILGLVIAFLYLGHLGMYPLFNPDEGRYAEIPREMLATGNFITPHLNGVEYFEKPALQYWFNALFMAIFGENEFAVRLFPALTALGGIYCTYVLGKKMFDKATGILAALMVATSFLYLVIGSLNILDMAIAFFLTAALTTYYFYGRTMKKAYLYWVYIFMGLGLLTKGLIGIVLVGGIVYCYLLLTRQWKLMLKNISLPGILLFLAVVFPWFYLVCKANPDFFQFFFIHEHFQRYLTKVHNRYEPFYFFVPCIIFGIMPWTGFLLSWRKKLCRQWSVQGRDYLYLILWSGLIFIFFSISDSKLVPYIVPCIPPLAILLADCILKGGRLKLPMMINTLLGLIFGIALIFAGIKFTNYGASPELVLPMSLVLILGNLFILVKIYRGEPLEKILSYFVVFALLFSFATWPLINGMAQYRTGKAVAAAVTQRLAPGDTVIMYKDYLQDLPFYTKQRIMLYNYTGELEFGSKHKSGEGWFIDDETLQRQWADKPVILVVPNKKFKEAQLQLHLSQTADDIQVVGKYTVIKKKTAP